ncbi:hypothetical protein D3C76_888210 [compost metagenome]
MAIQLAYALFAPGQVVDFFLGGVLHGFAYLGQFGGQCLALVQRLGADFAGMVDAHEAGNVAALGVIQVGIRLDDGRGWAGRLAAEGQQGAHGGIGLQQQAVERRVVTFGSHRAPPQECARQFTAIVAGSLAVDQPGGQCIWRWPSTCMWMW